MLGRSVVFCVLCASVLAHRRRDDNTQTTASTVAASTHITPDDGPETRSPSGVFRGSWMETRRGRVFQAYRGIRYAEPPVGELRFQPPKLIENYEGVVDASQEGPACPMPTRPNYYVDEDCLMINVYTPTNNVTKPLPVIVFIHAGGFYSMSGRSDLAGPHYLLDKDVVFVAFNYRLGSLGWISTGDQLAPGNNGMKDQVAALRWVQRNIRAFGGDNNLVTISGCSAGSTSVMLHMISPMSKGLFHRAISMSASPVSKGTTPNHQYHLAVRQAELLNCPTNNSKVIMDCLKTKPWRELGLSLNSFFQFGGGDPVRIWGPVVEIDFGQERFLSIDPLDAILQGKMHTVPYIISQTTNEFFWKAFFILRNETLINEMNSEWERIAPVSFMLPAQNASAVANRLREAYLKDKPLANDNASTKALGQLYGDSIAGFPVHRLANLMCRYSPHPVYYYQFNYIGNNSHYQDPVTGKPLGVAHHDDLIYLFTRSYRFPMIEPTSPHSRLVDQMTDIWYNFARYGDPNPRGDTPALGALRWPPMTGARRRYLRVGPRLTLHSDMFQERFALWDQLYPLYSAAAP